MTELNGRRGDGWMTHGEREKGSKVSVSVFEGPTVDGGSLSIGSAKASYPLSTKDETRLKYVISLSRDRMGYLAEQRFGSTLTC